MVWNKFDEIFILKGFKRKILYSAAFSKFKLSELNKIWKFEHRSL